MVTKIVLEVEQVDFFRFTQLLILIGLHWLQKALMILDDIVLHF